MKPQITRSAKDGVSTNTKATYTTGVIWIPCLNFGMFSTGDQDFGFVDIYT